MFNNILDIQNYLNDTQGSKWSNDIVITSHKDQLIVVSKITIDGITRSCCSVSDDIDNAIFKSMKSCVMSFCTNDNENKYNNQTDAVNEEDRDSNDEFIKNFDEEEELEFTDENIKKFEEETKMMMEDLKQREENRNPLVKQGLVREDQIEFINEFKEEFKIESDDQFNLYIANWAENTGNCSITNKKQLIYSGIKTIDSFIEFIKKTKNFHKNGIAIPDTI